MKIRKIFYCFLLIAIILCGGTGCIHNGNSNSSSNIEYNLELLSFEAECEKKIERIIESRKNKNNNDDDEILTSYIDNKFYLQIKNVNRATFLDMEIFIESINERVVFNEGNGDYQCSVNTKFNNDLDMWISEVTFNFELVEEYNFKDTIEIKALNFIEHQTSNIKAHIPSTIDRRKTLVYSKESIVDSILPIKTSVIVPVFDIKEEESGLIRKFTYLEDLVKVEYSNEDDNKFNEYVGFEIESDNKCFEIVQDENEKYYINPLFEGKTQLKIYSKYKEDINCTIDIEIYSMIKSLITNKEDITLVECMSININELVSIIIDEEWDYYLKERDIGPDRNNYLTYEIISGDNDVFEFYYNGLDNYNLVAKKEGKCVAKISSIYDSSKSCLINIEVLSNGFNNEISRFTPDDDFSNVLNENKSFVSGLDGYGEYYIKNIHSTKWYCETTMIYHASSYTENFPKIGIITTVATSKENKKDGDGLAVYIDLMDCHNRSYWDVIGVCEFKKEGGWAWNSNIDNHEARYKDSLTALEWPYYTKENSLTLGVLRDGFIFHVYLNGKYCVSFETLHNLLGDGENPISSAAGLFTFNSEVTFKNYYATTNDETINSLIPSDFYLSTGWR